MRVCAKSLHFIAIFVLAFAWAQAGMSYEVHLVIDVEGTILKRIPKDLEPLIVDTPTLKLSRTYTLRANALKVIEQWASIPNIRLSFVDMGKELSDGKLRELMENIYVNVNGNKVNLRNISDKWSRAYDEIDLTSFEKNLSKVIFIGDSRDKVVSGQESHVLTASRWIWVEDDWDLYAKKIADADDDEKESMPADKAEWELERNKWRGIHYAVGELIQGHYNGSAGALNTDLADYKDMASNIEKGNLAKKITISKLDQSKISNRLYEGNLLLYKDLFARCWIEKNRRDENFDAETLLTKVSSRAGNYQKLASDIKDRFENHFKKSGVNWKKYYSMSGRAKDHRFVPDKSLQTVDVKIGLDDLCKERGADIKLSRGEKELRSGLLRFRKELSRDIYVYHWYDTKKLTPGQNPLQLMQFYRSAWDTFLGTADHDEMGIGLYASFDPIQSKNYGDRVVKIRVDIGTKFLDLRRLDPTGNLNDPFFVSTRARAALEKEGCTFGLFAIGHPSKRSFSANRRCHDSLLKAVASLDVDFIVYNWDRGLYSRDRDPENLSFCRPISRPDLPAFYFTSYKISKQNTTFYSSPDEAEIEAKTGKLDPDKHIFGCNIDRYPEDRI